MSNASLSSPAARTWWFIRYWLVVFLWMGMIFTASGDTGSFQHSSRLIAPLVRWLFPHISDEALHAVVVAARKCAHLTEYAVLAVLLWRALLANVRPAAPPVRWSRAGLALALAALYAASDEFHQTFVPTRQGSVWDVLLDTCGAAAGLAVAGLLVWRK